MVFFPLPQPPPRDGDLHVLLIPASIRTARMRQRPQRPPRQRLRVSQILFIPPPNMEMVRRSVGSSVRLAARSSVVGGAYGAYVRVNSEVDAPSSACLHSHGRELLPRIRHGRLEATNKQPNNRCEPNQHEQNKKTQPLAYTNDLRFFARMRRGSEPRRHFNGECIQMRMDTCIPYLRRACTRHPATGFS